MPQGLGTQLGLGGGRSATSSGAAPSSGFANTYSCAFDGSDDYMIVAASSDFSFGTGNFSLNFWFKMNNIGSGATAYYPLLDLRPGGSDTAPSFYISNHSGYRFYVWSGSGVIANYNTTPAAGEWHHGAYTRDGTTGTVYLNGSSVASGTDNTNYNTSTPAPRTGGPPPSVYGSYLDGLIDELAIFSSALSSSDVTAIYNSGVPDDLSSYSPLGWWRMGDVNGASGTTITDQGSGGNNGTLTNGPTYSTDVPS